MATFTLTVLALASFYHVSTAQLSGQTVKLYSCDVTKYQGVLYKKDSILGANQFLKTSTFEDCVQQCLMQKTPCSGVNFLQSQSLCGVHKSAIVNGKADRSSYDSVRESVHASVDCAASQKASGPVGCGKQAPQYTPNINKFQRIIGGVEAKPNSWPWLVTLIADFRNGYAGNCGSSLIRVKEGVEQSDIILTAAHCVTDDKTQGTNPKAFAPDQMEAVAGNHHREKYDAGEQRRTGAKIVVHPGFRFTPQTGAQNDIAIIKLDKPFTFTDTIRPICLPAAGEAIPAGKLCVVAGWGRTNSNNGDTAQALLQIVAPAQTAATCKQGWGRTYIEDQMICAGSLRGDGGTCQGDSGGTLACQRTDGSWGVYGAVSFGVGGTCLAPNQPSIFARVSNYMDWINQNVKALTSL